MQGGRDRGNRAMERVLYFNVTTGTRNRRAQRRRHREERRPKEESHRYEEGSDLGSEHRSLSFPVCF